MRVVLLILPALLLAGSASAQDAVTSTSTSWTWHAGASGFFGFNYQQRRFRDFHAVESQNWLMAAAERQSPRATVRLHSMLSLEAMTMKDLGSPQVFQTGETFRGAPLIDYQHPHDVFLGLGAEYRRRVGDVMFIAAADAVGAPSLGPTPFMHRASARDNPQVPLSHHTLDSSHVTPGVLRGGVERGVWRAEASWFRGREPDENRLDLDLGALDSAAIRLSWNRGPWSAQMSGAYLTQPETVVPYDARKLTASMSYTATGGAGLSWTAAFGQSREIHGNLEAYLVEVQFGAGFKASVYLRAESVAKDILDAGFHPPNAFHRHRQSQVSAFTGGYVRDVLQTRAGTLGLGGDVTGYLVPSNLRDSYGSPASFHLFVRIRTPAPAGTGIHVH